MARRNVHSAFEMSATISGISFANGEEISLTITCRPLSKRRANNAGLAAGCTRGHRPCGETGMIRECYHDVTPRGEFPSRVRVCAFVCPQGGGPEKGAARAAAEPLRGSLDHLRLAWRLWPLSYTGETN